MELRIPKMNYNKSINVWQHSYIPTDDTTHEELIELFKNYYISNMYWMKTGKRVPGNDTRYWLMRIKRKVSERRQVILDWKHAIDRDKPKAPVRTSPEHKEAVRQFRQEQIQKEEEELRLEMESLRSLNQEDQLLHSFFDDVLLASSHTLSLEDFDIEDIDLDLEELDKYTDDDFDDEE